MLTCIRDRAACNRVDNRMIIRRMMYAPPLLIPVRWNVFEQGTAQCPGGEQILGQLGGAGDDHDRGSGHETPALPTTPRIR